MSEDEIQIKPIYLLADSQLLFWKDPKNNEPWLKLAKKNIHVPSPSAAYLGASNDDVKDYYDIFLAAMETIGISNCAHIKAQPTKEDVAFLEKADLILLAGGDPKKGWDAFCNAGIHEILPKRYYNGALLKGVSAGALLLGKRTWSGPTPTDDNIFPTLKLVPAVLSVHEDEHWPNLHKLVELSGGITLGIGIPAGGGAIYHPEHMIQPIRQPAHEIWLNEGDVKESILMPGDEPEELKPEVLVPSEIIDPRQLN